MPRLKIVAGNWKMYTTRTGAVELARAVVAGNPAGPNTRVVLCPPFPWLTAVADAIAGSPVQLGAQDCAAEKEGAFTGQVAPQMLLEAGCKYTLIGHSERRHGLNETDEFLNKKAKTAIAAGLDVIFCIGELLAEREASRTESVLHRQLTVGLAGIGPDQTGKLVVAYEPVWAIGTGKVATTEEAQTAHKFIRQTFSTLFGSPAAENLVIQYGGSVKADNAAALMAQPDVDGALVGGASLKADSFHAIVKAAG